MKEFEFKEVFCELLSGAIAIGVVFLYIKLLSIHRFDELTFIFDFPLLTAFFVASYLMGLVIDGIGLAIGEWKLDNLLATTSVPDETKKKNFWASTSEKIKYRETQWTYYSLYRNLIILFGLTFVNLIILFFNEGFNFKRCFFLIVLVLLEIALIKSARVLINLYYDLTK